MTLWGVRTHTDTHTHTPQLNSREKSDVTRNARLPSPGLPGAGQRVSGAKETNFTMGIQVNQLKAMFTFGVNSVFACAHAYVCVCAGTLVPWERVSRSSPPLWAKLGLLAHLREHKTWRCKAEGPRISEKCLWKYHKGISWMSAGVWEMGFDTTGPWLRRVGG